MVGDKPTILVSIDLFPTIVHDKELLMCLGVKLLYEVLRIISFFLILSMTADATLSKKHQISLMRFWWSWRVPPPRPPVYLGWSSTGIVRFAVLGNGYRSGQTSRSSNPES